MQFSFLTFLTLATATNATFLNFNKFKGANSYSASAPATPSSYSPSAPVNTNGLNSCQAACVAAAMPKLGDGSYALSKTPASTFCSHPELQSWYATHVGPCDSTCVQAQPQPQPQPQPGRLYIRTFGLKGGLGVKAGLGFKAFALKKGGGGAGAGAGVPWIKQTCPNVNVVSPGTQNQGYDGSDVTDAPAGGDDNAPAPVQDTCGQASPASPIEPTADEPAPIQNGSDY